MERIIADVSGVAYLIGNPQLDQLEIEAEQAESRGGCHGGFADEIPGSGITWADVDEMERQAVAERETASREVFGGESPACPECRRRRDEEAAIDAEVAALRTEWTDEDDRWAEEMDRRNAVTDRVPALNNPAWDTARRFRDEELIEAIRLADEEPAVLNFRDEDQRTEWMAAMADEVLRRSGLPRRETRVQYGASIDRRC